MDSIVQSSAYFGFFITLIWLLDIHHRLQREARSTLCNPLLLTIIFIIAISETDGNISYASYDNWRKIH